MINFHSGYIIDEIFFLLIKKGVSKELLSKALKEYCYFQASNLDDYFSIEDIEPTLAVAYNYISRGLPTRASIFSATELLNSVFENHNIGADYSGKEVVINLPDNFLSSTNITDLNNFIGKLPEFTLEKIVNLGSDYLNLAKLLTSSICIGRIHKAIFHLMLSNQLDISKQNWNITIIENHINCGNIAIIDLRQLLQHLFSLESKNRKLPLINLSIIQRSETANISEMQDAVLDIAFYYNEETRNPRSIKTNTYIKIDSTREEQQKVKNQFLTFSKIKYKSLGADREELSLEGERKYLFDFINQSQGDALKYFLQNTFRKVDFKAGQLSIINRALQCKDVIGLLPTGGGKSLTYQLCSLLQPGISIIIDPINSLMRDQFEKLLDNFIDSTVYINSFNSEEERKTNVEKLTNGEILFAFVSPERLQIQKFRKILESCEQNQNYYSYAIIDEAHCVSEWGHDFRQTYLRLAKNLKRFCKTYNGKLVLLGLTATASFDVLADIQRELEMPEDAIVRLPEEAVDRKELKFKILKVDTRNYFEPEYWKREKELGRYKYPKLEKHLKELPTEIEKLAGIKNIGSTHSSPIEKFYSSVDNRFHNAGIIFCPTTSNALGNGVLSMRNGYSVQWDDSIKGLDSRCDFLHSGTFFSGGDDDSIKDGQIDEEAKNSFENQTKFINDEINLMYATKAFGMGIDKPNIRYTVHYSFPGSVESFYQEAGRAGRDGGISLCTILYNPLDELSNVDFLANSFKGIKREQAILEEFLTEIKYENQFFVNYIASLAREEFNETIKLKINDPANPTTLFVNGKWNDDPNQRVNFGWFRLRDLTPTARPQNVTEEKANAILTFLATKIRELVPDSNYKRWLLSVRTEGIENLLAQRTKHILPIGFTNNTITEIVEYVKSIGNNSFSERVVRAAYNFSNNPDAFLDRLNYNYAANTRFQEHLSLTEEITAKLKADFWKIRNSIDTQRAIYRLSIIGIVDDYVIDYAGRSITIDFTGKDEKTYKKNFVDYLRRYVGKDGEEHWLNKLEDSPEESLLRKYLFTLTEFVYTEIFIKRQRAIKYMKELCELGITEGQQVFRENIIYYFTSKYARNEFLPSDTENGRIENLELVKKYINYIFNPPDGLGQQIDNLKHLRGACARVQVGQSEENATLTLLNNFALLSIESNIGTAISENELIAQALEGIYRGFKKFEPTTESSIWADYIFYFKDSIYKINDSEELKELVESVSNRLFVSYFADWIEKFNGNYIDCAN